MKHVTYRNGYTLVLVVALVNALLEILISFGVHLTPTEQSAISGFVNASIVLIARTLGLPYRDGPAVTEAAASAAAKPPIPVPPLPPQA